MKYAIIDQNLVGDGSDNKIFKVILEAEDGYQEAHTFIGPGLLTIRKALREFQRSRDDLAAAQAAALNPPVLTFTTVVSGSTG